MADPVDTEISGCKVSTTPLPFKHSQPLLAQIAEILSIAARELVPLLASGKIDLKADVTDPSVIFAILPTLKELSHHLDGRLDKLAPKLLATTRVALPSPTGPVEWYDLVKPSDWEYVFDTRPELYLPATIHAGRVTFGRFFPVKGRSGSAATAS